MIRLLSTLAIILGLTTAATSGTLVENDVYELPIEGHGTTLVCVSIDAATEVIDNFERYHFIWLNMGLMPPNCLVFSSPMMFDEGTKLASLYVDDENKLYAIVEHTYEDEDGQEQKWWTFIQGIYLKKPETF